MRMTYVFHIAAGVIGLLSGFTALAVMKGSPLHRRAGMFFVVAMLATSVGGLVMAIGRGVAPAINIPAALLTSYLVITALTTVRPLATGERWLDVGAMLVALAVGVSSLTFGFEALIGPNGMRKGMPAFPFFMFGVVGLIGGVSDIGILRSGRLQGPSRLARHLWRMCFALFIAALSFFLGQAKVFPRAIRIPGLLALPVLAVLVTMVYWLWRIRATRSSRNIVVIRATEAA